MIVKILPESRTKGEKKKRDDEEKILRTLKVHTKLHHHKISNPKNFAERF